MYIIFYAFPTRRPKIAAAIALHLDHQRLLCCQNFVDHIAREKYS